MKFLNKYIQQTHHGGDTLKKIISFSLVLFLILVQSFVQAQNKGFPTGWETSGWDATIPPSINQTNPNNLLPMSQQKIGFGEWNRTSSKTGSIITSQFSLTGITNLSLDVGYNEYYITYMSYKILISTNNGVNWNQLWAATSTGTTNWRWKTVVLNLSAYSGSARLKFIYDGQVEGDLVAFDLGKLLATGVFTVDPPPPPVNNAPVITLLGANPLYIANRNDCCIEPGFTATDTQDGNLTSKVQITTNLDCANLKNGIFYRAYSVVDNGGLVETKIRTLIVSGITGVNDEGLPTKYLLANYPNPFNPQTIIRFEVPEASNIKINVYDIVGRNVTELIDEHFNPGIYEVPFDATGLASGIYFYTLETKNKILRQKMVLLR